MPLWDKVRQELDKAGTAARDLMDEGKLRIDAFRARREADEAAATLGYAFYRAAQAGGAVEPDVRDRLMNALVLREAEARRLEGELDAVRGRAAGAGPAGAGSTGAGSTPETPESRAP